MILGRPWLTRLKLSAVTVGLLASAVPRPAAAYSTESIVSDPCHERLSMRALRAARLVEPRLEPLAPVTRDDRALLDDLPFDVWSDMNDLGAASVLLGNRHVDLQGNEPDDLDQLAVLHSNPTKQMQHCLRSPNEDEPEGSATAIQQCREFIRSRVLDAALGLGADGRPSAQERITQKDVFLEFRGLIDAELPRFYFRMGEALHALQDSFSHTYRTADALNVVTVLNYAEYVEGHLDEAHDGPAHSSELDRCVDLDAYRQTRFDVATTASVELLQAAFAAHADPSGGDLEAVLDRYLTLCSSANDYCGRGGPCTAENNWCDAPETGYEEPSSCVCGAAPGARTSSAGPFAAAALLLLAFMRRRRLLPLPLAFAAFVFSPEARAQTETAPALPPTDPGVPVSPSDPAPPPSADTPVTDTPAPESPPTSPAAPGATTSPVLDTETAVAVAEVKEEIRETRRPYFPFGVQVAGSIAVQNGAFAGAVGARYRLGDNWIVGIDGEYNPWISWASREVRAGTLNFYGTGVLRFPLKFQRVNLRSTLQLGISRINFDLYGVPEGTVGPYFGFTLLGLDIELGRQIYLIVNPSHIAVPVPQTRGVPYAYPQYRFTLGLQFGA